MVLSNASQKAKISVKGTIAKLSGRCKMDIERDALKHYKCKVGTTWYELHMDDAISSVLYNLAFDTVQKQKVENLKRSRRNLKMELSRLGEETALKGATEMNANYILNHAKSIIAPNRIPPAPK